MIRSVFTIARILHPSFYACSSVAKFSLVMRGGNWKNAHKNAKRQHEKQLWGDVNASF